MGCREKVNLRLWCFMPRGRRQRNSAREQRVFVPQR